jgi:hypothetical protein
MGSPGLPNPKPTTINPKDSRYERGTTLGQVNVDDDANNHVISGTQDIDRTRKGGHNRAVTINQTAAEHGMRSCNGRSVKCCIVTVRPADGIAGHMSCSPMGKADHMRIPLNQQYD